MTRTTSLIGAALLTLLLAGCGSNSPSSPASSGTTPSPAPSSSTPTNAPTSASASPLPAPVTGIRGLLLDPSALPAAASGASWTGGVVAPAPATGLGTCNRVPLTSLGAEKVLQRSYAAGADQVIAQAATFPDDITAHRALGSLDGLRRRCPDNAVGGALNATLPPGVSGWYYVTGTGAASEGFGAAIGGHGMVILKVSGYGSKAIDATGTLLSTLAAGLR